MKPEHKLKKGDKLIVNIESLAPGGEGVAKPGGIPVFVSRVAPGDKVEVELFDVRKNFAFGKCVRILQASQARVEPPCKVFKVCGGCHWQHIAYEQQVQIKTDLVRQALKHIGGLDPDLVLNAVPADEPLFYRNKVQYPVTSPARSSRILAGYYKEGSHELVNIKHCPVQPEPLDRMLECSKLALEQNGITAYDEEKHRGVVRHIAARYSFSHREILVTFVINDTAPGDASMLSRLTAAAKQLMEAVPEVVGVCVNFNSAKGNRIMGTDWRVLVGRDHLLEKISSDSVNATQQQRAGITFKLTPMSFFQVNTSQSKRLLELVFDAMQRFAPQNPQLVIDAYGGVGTIALWLASSATRLISIDEVQPAIDDGREIARTNNVSNVEYIHGRVEDVLPELAKNQKPDVVILDPPRKGVAAEVIQAVLASSAPLLIYVSCNPSTLARDLKLLVEGGYDIRMIQPLDMFPQTHHVETICAATRSNIH